MGPPTAIPPLRLRPALPHPAVRRLRTLADSNKLIKNIINKSSDIAEFLVQENNLKNSIENLFGHEDEDTKIQIANLHFGNHLRSAGDLVISEMQITGGFSLDVFMERVFQMTFPSAPIVLECAYKDIRQKTDESIVEYGRRFQLFCSKLRREIHTQLLKFIEGLSDSAVRSHLIRSQYSTLTFLEILNHAISIEQSMSSTRGKTMGGGGEKIHLAMTNSDTDEDPARVLKIFDKDVGFYINEGMSKKLPVGACWQCLLIKNHRAYLCPQKTCKWCHKDTNKVKHYSINCKLCPKDLTYLNIQKPKDGWNPTKARTIKAIEEPVPDELLNFAYHDEDE